MRNPLAHARLMLLLAALAPMSSTAGHAETVASSTAADSIPGTAINCVDFRTRESLVVHGQHVLADGSILGSSPTLASRLCVGVAQEVFSVSISDGANGSLVVWVDNSDELGDIYAQHLLPGGTVAPGWPADGVPVCVLAGSQYQPAITLDGQGGLVAVWVDYREGSAGRIYAQHVSSAGQVTWEPNGVALSASAGAQSSPGIATDGAGGALVAWTDTRSGEPDIYALHLEGNGRVTPGTPDGGALLAGGAGAQNSPRLVPTSFGALAVWEDTREGDLSVMASAINSDGSAGAGWPAGGVSVGSGPGLQFMPVAAPDGQGGCIVAWVDMGLGSARVMAQRLSATVSSPLWPVGGVRVSDGTDPQFGPAIVSDGAGGAIVGWEQSPIGGDADISAQHINGTGARTWGEAGTALCRAAGQQSNVSLASDGAGGALATWVDAATRARASFTRLRPVDPGPTPTLKSVESGPGRAKLVWECPPGDTRNLDLMREPEGQEWQALVSLKPSENGELAYEDRTVRPGTTVRYRLAMHRGGDEVLFPEIVVAIPLPKPLALRFARHDRTGKVLTLAMTLETDAPASMEVIDVQGRRFASRNLGAPGAGDHEIPVVLPMKLPSGLYFVRLIQGRAMRTTRLVVVK